MFHGKPIAQSPGGKFLHRTRSGVLGRVFVCVAADVFAGGYPAQVGGADLHEGLHDVGDAQHGGALRGAGGGARFVSIRRRRISAGGRARWLRAGKVARAELFAQGQGRVGGADGDPRGLSFSNSAMGAAELERIYRDRGARRVDRAESGKERDPEAVRAGGRRDFDHHLFDEPGLCDIEPSGPGHPVGMGIGPALAGG